jgi:hypothetical protein
MAERRTRAETKALLLDEGTRQLLAQGLKGTAEIRLKDVCDQLEERRGVRITPGSVYERIWADQRDFQLEVLATVLAERDLGEIDRALERAVASVDAALAGADRDAVVRRFCKLAADGLVNAVLDSAHWQIWVGAWGSTASTPELRDDHRIGEVIEAGYLRSTTHLGALVDSALDNAGLTLRPGLTSYQLGVALGSLVEGLSLRLRYDRDDTNELTTSEDGEDQAWGLPGVCFEALVDRFYT